MFPIDFEAARTFQLFLWEDMPGGPLPDDPATVAPADSYSPAALAVFRLSSKTHWDLPIDVEGAPSTFWSAIRLRPCSTGRRTATAPRNFDEIRFWADYVTPGPPASDYIYDDDGTHGGLPAGARFVIAGDQNSDPLDGDSIPGAAQQLASWTRG